MAGNGSYLNEIGEFLASAFLDSKPFRRPQAAVSLNTQGATARSIDRNDPRRPPAPSDNSDYGAPPNTAPRLFLPRQIDPTTGSPFQVSYQYPSPGGAAAPTFTLPQGRPPVYAETPEVGPLEPLEAWKGRKSFGDKTSQYGTPCLIDRPTEMVAQWSQQARPDTQLGPPSRFMRFGGSPLVLG